MLSKTLCFIGTVVALIGITFMAVDGVQDNLYRMNTVPAAQAGLLLAGTGLLLLMAAVITEKLQENGW